MSGHQEDELSFNQTDPYRAPNEVTAHTKDPHWFPAKNKVATALSATCVVAAAAIWLLFRGAPQPTGVSAPTPIQETEVVIDDQPLDIKEFVQQYTYTRGGAHVLKDDATVKFLVDDNSKRVVDVDISRMLEGGEKSPYGLWGTLGTKDANQKTDRTSESD
ncbi:MAG: hypothetical protein KDB00_24860 [Planctomycetales bacterium]|nr:hypothetical protein [Planctomycetales bacterium]